MWVQVKTVSDRPHLFVALRCIFSSLNLLAPKRNNQTYHHLHQPQSVSGPITAGHRLRVQPDRGATSADMKQRLSAGSMSESVRLARSELRRASQLRTADPPPVHVHPPHSTSPLFVAAAAAALSSGATRLLRSGGEEESCRHSSSI